MLTKLRNLLRSKRLEAEIREELDFHRSQTSGSFGNVMHIQDQVRDASTFVWLQTWVQDVRYGLRQLRKSPVFVAVAVLSLALGIGANTAIFTLINAVMLQSLPVRDPGRLVLFYDGISSGVYSGDAYHGDIFSYQFWQYLQSENKSFEDLCAFRQRTDRVLMHVAGTSGSGASENRASERAEVHLVSGSYFHVLGVQAAAGRTLQASDDRVDASRAAVISYPFWQSRFRGDRKLIGQDVFLNGASFTIVGVAAPEFFGERVQAPPDFWLPLSFQPQVLENESWLGAHDVYWLNMLGRLRPGVSIREASTAVTSQFQRFYSAQAGTALSLSTTRKLQSVRVELKAGGSGISGLRYLYSQPLHLLMAVVGVVLFIACANIATLLLARASKRGREFAARLALGASRSRLMRQVLTESLLLSIAGGLAGILIAWWSVKGLVHLLSIDPVVNVRPDFLVLAFTLGISVFTGVLFGIIPAMRFSKMEPRLGMTTGLSARGTGLGSAQTLIVVQVALSFVLLLGTGLLARSLVTLEYQNVGFNRENVLIVHTDPHLAGFEKEKLLSLYRKLDERLNRIPGVLSASIARYTPVSGTSVSGTFATEGHFAPAGTVMDLYQVDVGPHFFETLAIPLRLGRPIEARDASSSERVAVVNETFVARYLPNRQPLGQRFSFGSPFQAPGVKIVGVAADSKYYDLRESPKAMAFLSASQLRGDSAYAGELVLRTAIPTSAIMPEVRRVLNEISTRLVILDFTTLDHEIDRSLYQQKMVTSLCSVFGLTALLLAGIGIYGTVAYAVARRTTEIGIRMAVGAQRRAVLFMVLRESIVLTAVGLAAGLPLAWAAMNGIRTFLYGVPASDPLAIGSAVVLIAAASLLAGYLPARRATKIDPLLALRYE